MTERNRKSWKPGQSGNPKGKPPGSGELQKLRASISAAVPEILATLVTAAKAGDMQAARLILERVLPPIKATEHTQAIPLSESDSLTANGRSVLSAVASGDLAPGQASQLLTAIGAMARVTETDELVRRIGALEDRANERITK
jgi:hypothetical protein